MWDKLKYRFVFSSLALLFLYSCTQYKNAFINRNFHNLTAHFNGYFYAKESLKDGVTKIETNYKDDYTKTLPIFLYPDKESAKNTFPEMDRAIKKASTCIQKHAIKDKQSKVEIPNTGKWIDDCWNTIGKSHFYKREFFSGVEAFEYVQAVYKSKQKYEAWLWLAKTYLELNALTSAQNYLHLCENDKKFPKEYKGHFEALYAEFYMKQNAYDDVIKKLKEAIKYTKDHNYRARYHFIMGQLYELKDDAGKAKIHYALAIKNKPIYDMVFYAKMKESLMQKDPAGIAKAKKDLLKMTKDIKNEDLKDVIYYTLGQIEENEKNTDQAVDYYVQSVRTSVSNQQQKGKSFLKLADINFDRENYQAAAGYYDSTVTFIKDDYPGYQDIISKKKSLDALVLQITTIKSEDSLRRVADMDSASRNKFIRRIIVGVYEDERKAQELKQQQAANATTASGNGMFTPQGGTQGSGQWYFYNSLLKAQGFNDFIKRWGGNRKNEDNWRRSNKAQTFNDLNDNNSTTDKKDTAKKGHDSLALRSNDVHQPEYYLKSLPFTQADRDSSDKRILEAYYALGSIYREQLNNTRKSAETFETMNKRFPRNKYEASSYYQMYLIYMNSKEDAKAQAAKDFILTNYPNSDYAPILRDPSSAKGLSARKTEIENYYADTYDLFTKKNYKESYERSHAALIKYDKNDYTPRFAYLQALSEGYLFGVDSLEKALKLVTVKYAKSDVYAPAKATLDAIKKQKNTYNPLDTLNDPANLPPSVYAFNETSIHYFMVVLNGTKDVNYIKESISDFNKEFFSTSKFETITIPKTEKCYIFVKTFNNKDEAMEYFNFALTKDIFKNLDKREYQLFAISVENMTVLLKRQDIDEYKTFFNAKYIGVKQ